MTVRWARFARVLLPPNEQQWFDAAIAELPYVDATRRIQWCAGLAGFVLGRSLRTTGAAAATTCGLVVLAAATGLIDLNIEPTSVSLLLLLSASALGGYVAPRAWWLAGPLIGSSISLTAAIATLFGLHPPGRPVETSTATILILLLLVVPGTFSSWAGARLRARLRSRQ